MRAGVFPFGVATAAVHGSDIAEGASPRVVAQEGKYESLQESASFAAVEKRLAAIPADHWRIRSDEMGP